MTGNQTLLVTTLRNLVPLLVRAGRDEPALALAAALDAASNLHDSYGEEERRLTAAVDQAQARLDPSVTVTARAEGAGMSPSLAGRFALAALDSLVHDRTPTQSPTRPVDVGD